MYRYIPNKKKKKIHEVAPNGRTYCQAENSVRKLVDSRDFPKGRRACAMCWKIKREREAKKLREPRLSVLMGETID